MSTALLQHTVLSESQFSTYLITDDPCEIASAPDQDYVFQTRVDWVVPSYLSVTEANHRQ